MFDDSQKQKTACLIMVQLADTENLMTWLCVTFLYFDKFTICLYTSAIVRIVVVNLGWVREIGNVFAIIPFFYFTLL